MSVSQLVREDLIVLRLRLLPVETSHLRVFTNIAIWLEDGRRRRKKEDSCWAVERGRKRRHRQQKKMGLVFCTHLISPLYVHVKTFFFLQVLASRMNATTIIYYSSSPVLSACGGMNWSVAAKLRDECLLAQKLDGNENQAQWYVSLFFPVPFRISLSSPTTFFHLFFNV